MPVRRAGIAACAMAVVLLAVALVSGRLAYSAPAGEPGRSLPHHSPD